MDTNNETPFNTFHYLENAGNPHTLPELNYEPHLPYLVSLYGFESNAIVHRYAQADRIQGYMDIDWTSAMNDIKRDIANLAKLSSDEQPSSTTNSFLDATPEERVRLASFELYRLFLVSQQFHTALATRGPAPEFRANSDLLNNDSHADELSCLLPMIVERLCVEEIVGFKSIIAGLIHAWSRSRLVRYVVANEPMRFSEVVDHLVYLAARMPTQYRPPISDMLYTLCELAPHHAARIRLCCAELQLMPNLLFRITLAFCHDEIPFMNGLFTASPAWLTTDLATSRDHILRLKYKIFAEAQAELAKPEPGQLRLSGILRIMVALMGVFGAKYTEKELRCCIDVVKRATSERLVKLGICLLIFCSDQILQLSQDDLTELLARLIHSDYSEMLVLLAIHFHSGQIEQVERAVTETMGMQVLAFKKGHYNVKTLFTQDLFRDQVLAERALVLKVSRLVGVAGV